MGWRGRGRGLEMVASGHHAGHVGDAGKREGGAESPRGGEEGAFCPGPSTAAQTGRVTYYFSVLVLFKIFFFFFVSFCFVFFKKSLKISYWLHLQNVKCCCYQSLYRTVQSGQILTNKVSFSFFFFLLHHYYSMSHVSACVGQGAA